MKNGEKRNRKSSKGTMSEADTQSNCNSKYITHDLGWKLTAVKWGLSLAMCLVVGCYGAILAAFPVESFQNIKETIFQKMVDTPFGSKGGGLLVLFASPLLVLTLLAIINLEVSSRMVTFNREKAKGRASLQKHPLFIGGWMGIVSAAEFLWILLFLVMFTWIMGNYLIRDSRHFDVTSLKPVETVWSKKLKRTASHLGFFGLICLNFLFLPVSRGSVLLRALDIPFEHAVKYHIWLGYFMMTCFTLHGHFYIIAWYSEDSLSKIFNWAPHKVANFAGVIALLAGITMWVTSISWVRKRYFETFFWVHHLYIVFVFFMAFHVGGVLFNVAFCGIFLFVFDRFLRFCQSRGNVGVLTTKLLACGIFELTLIKPPGIKLHALNYIYLNIPEISKLEWHPFSVSSSPYDGDNWLKVLIKPSYGGWTHRLQGLVSDVVKRGRCPSNISAAVEGPYGHESDFFLQYETLVLVAGGIGISPFVAVLRDLLQRYQRQQSNLPSNVHLIWAVQKSEELQLLDLIPASAICPDYRLKFNLQIHAFVTRESSPISLECKPEAPASHLVDQFKKSRILASVSNAEAFNKPMSMVAGTGSNLWITSCFLASLLGYIVVYFSIYYFVVQPFEQESAGDGKPREGLPRWVKGLFNVISLILGVAIFGGFVASLWNYLGRLHQGLSEIGDENSRLLSISNTEDTVYANESADCLVHPSNTHFGQRPNLREIFDGCAKSQQPGANIGVLVCGPESLQISVAETCRAFNNIDYDLHKVAFSYHSLSFDL